MIILSYLSDNLGENKIEGSEIKEIVENFKTKCYCYYARKYVQVTGKLIREDLMDINNCSDSRCLFLKGPSCLIGKMRHFEESSTERTNERDQINNFTPEAVISEQENIIMSRKIGSSELSNKEQIEELTELSSEEKWQQLISKKHIGFNDKPGDKTFTIFCFGHQKNAKVTGRVFEEQSGYQSLYVVECQRELLSRNKS